MSGEVKKAEWRRNTNPRDDLDFWLQAGALEMRVAGEALGTRYTLHLHATTEIVQATVGEGRTLAVRHARRLLNEALAALPEEDA